MQRSSADAIVIGAGVLGTSIALHLSRLKYNVIVLDKLGVGMGRHPILVEYVGRFIALPRVSSLPGRVSYLVQLAGSLE